MNDEKSSIFLFFLVFLLTSSLAMPQTLLPKETPPRVTVKISYQEVLDQLRNLKIDQEQVASIENFSFSRETAVFNLEKGTLYLCQPVQNRVGFAVFSGAGNFRYFPLTKIEKEHLYRFYEKWEIDEKFKTLFLAFADTTLTELRKRLVFKSGRVSQDARNCLENGIKYLYRKKGKRYNYPILKTFLEQAESGLFYSQFRPKNHDPWFFEINPYATEEVRFKRRMKTPSFFHFAEIINQFHTKGEYQSGISSDTNKIDLHISRYVIDCTLKGNSLKFSAQTIIDLECLQPDLKWLSFTMFDEMEMDSAFWEDGRQAHYIKEKNNSALWVKADFPLQLKEKRKLRLHYHGKLIERQADWFYIRSSTGWYPKHADRAKAYFYVTFRVPKKFQFVSVGDLISDTTINNTRITRWMTGDDLRNFSFNVGFFKEYHVENNSIPPTTIYIANTGHREIGRSLSVQGIGSGKNMEQRVGKDIAGSIRFFETVFGRTANRFSVTDIPFGHGEAFPGLIHLSWKTFQFTRKDGSDEVFRAHEVAHQWWGIGVDFRSYHDQWISEGFSEYAGWWYLHEVVKKEDDDDKRFYKFLEDRRKEITDNRKYLFGRGQPAAPIWLGYRTQSSDTKGDYLVIIYKKGAWVLHMLRTMVTDLATMNDHRFRTLMKGFFQKYYNRHASTEDFIAYAEKSLGEDLGWYFNQWVYGTDIPKYVFSYKIEATAEGKFKALCRVKQNQVKEDFKMPVLIGIKIKDNEILPKRVWVEGPVTEFEMGEYSQKPRKIIFNYLESVLCEYKTEKWK